MEPRWRDSVHYLSCSLSYSFQMDGEPRARQPSIWTLVGDHGGREGGRTDGIIKGRGASLRTGRHRLALMDRARDVLYVFVVHNGCFHCVIFSLCSSIPINCGSSEARCWEISSEITEATYEMHGLFVNCWKLRLGWVAIGMSFVQSEANGGLQLEAHTTVYSCTVVY